MNIEIIFENIVSCFIVTNEKYIFIINAKNDEAKQKKDIEVLLEKVYIRHNTILKQ